MPETVVKDGSVDGVGGVRNRVDWKGRNLMECDGKAWNVMEGLERVPEWCRSVGNGLSEILRDTPISKEFPNFTQKSSLSYFKGMPNFT